MVANMPISTKPPQYSSPRGGAADHQHPYPWRLNPTMDAKAEHGTHHAGAVSPQESCSSWEARAYGEDASNLAVGIWPPRAYPCGFCRREFRSAQALGGHMNVHRRDRARLRQSSPPPPFHSSTLNLPLQNSGDDVHKSSQHDCSFAGINPKDFSAASLSKATTLPPTSLSGLSAISYQDPTASVAAKYPLDMAPSIPLRVQVLASEAASTLLLPQADQSSDHLHFRWPYSANFGSRNSFRSTVGAAGIKRSHPIDLRAWSGSPSCSSSTSTVPSHDTIDRDSAVPFMGAKACGRGSRHSPPPLQPEDEGPKKKSNFRNNPDIQAYRITNLTNSQTDDRTNHAQATRDSDNSVKVINKSACCSRPRQSATGDAGSECLDLELRLGPT